MGLIWIVWWWLLLSGLLSEHLRFVCIRFLLLNAEFSVLQAPTATTGPLPSIIAMQPPPIDMETFLLKLIEWTTFSVPTYDTAFEQANVILQYFLGVSHILLLGIYSWYDLSCHSIGADTAGTDAVELGDARSKVIAVNCLLLGVATCQYESVITDYYSSCLPFLLPAAVPIDTYDPPYKRLLVPSELLCPLVFD